MSRPKTPDQLPQPAQDELDDRVKRFADDLKRETLRQAHKRGSRTPQPNDVDFAERAIFAGGNSGGLRGLAP
jgi:histone H3/H4